MPNFETIVMCVAALVVLYALWLVQWISFLRLITRLHGGREIAKKYPPEWVKYHYENGGW